jgi:hypothetical protein
MIKEIRDYFNLVVSEVDKDLRFDGFIFDTEKIGDTQIDHTYKLVLGNTTTTRIDSSYEATMDVELWIYKSSGYDRVEDFDDTYCKAIEIASRAQDQRLITQSGFIKSIIAGNILPESFESNDNAMRFRLQFTVSAYFELE